MIQNVLTGKYIRDNKRFADLCNFYLYKGKHVINEEELTERDVTILGRPFTEKGAHYVEKIRDVLKACTVKSANGITYVIIGVENQANIHYAMVIRNMVQDALNYAEQVENIAKRHRGDNNLKAGAEYLSGFTKDDKLCPVITITLYWNSGEWDGPRTLQEMLDVSDEELMQYIPDYRLNLIVPDEITDFSDFETELGIVLQMFQCAKDKDMMKSFAMREKSIVVEKETADLLNECLKLKLDISAEECEVIDLCKAMQDWAAEEREQGIEQGIEQGRVLMLVSLMKDGYISKEVAAEKMGVRLNELEDMLLETTTE